MVCCREDNNKVWFAKLLVIFSYTSSSGSEIEAERKEKFMLFSNHNGSLLRRQPGAD